MPRRLASSEATEPARPISSINVSNSSEVVVPDATIFCSVLHVGGEIDDPLGVAFVGEASRPAC